MTLYLFKHSNYYNRILKRYDDINDYIENSIQLGVYQNINFKPYDGVQTFQILNHQGETPDYIICVDDSLAINSRWYVIEDERLLNGQYRYTLLRDVIADYYNEIGDSPCFVEKGLLKADDTRIYNSENMSFNQIKQKEWLIKDRTKSRWIVGYIAKNAEEVDGDGNPRNIQIGEIASDLSSAISVSENDFEILSTGNTYNPAGTLYFLKFPLQLLSQKLLNEVLNNAYSRTFELYVNIFNPDIPTTAVYYGMNMSDDTSGLSFSSRSIAGVNITIGPSYDGNAIADLISPNLATAVRAMNSDTTVVDIINSKLPKLNNLTAGKYQELKEYNNKIIKYGNKYYRVNVVEHAPINYDLYEEHFNDAKIIMRRFYEILNPKLANASANQDVTIASVYSDQYLAATVQGNSSIKAQPVSVYTQTWSSNTLSTTNPISFELTEITFDVTYTKLSNPGARVGCYDGLYDVFAIPYDGVNMYIPTTNGFKYVRSGSLSPGRALALSQKIAEVFNIGGDSPKIYDLQLLPFCPCREYLTSNMDIDLRELTANTQYNIIYSQQSGTSSTNNPEPISAVFWCNKPKDSFNISTAFITNNTLTGTTESNPLEKKIKSETTFYRISSPGNTRYFDFNEEMFNGLSSLNIQILYQPINPFIKITPIFSGLYGIYSEYDGKGLIFDGDFSIPCNSSAWTNYQVNNKNYSEIFNRSVQNLEVSHKYQRIQDISNAITGSIQGVVSGATAGTLAGGVPGAIAGGVMGGISSGIGGAVDVHIGDQLRQEALDYKKDMFGYELDNIKALPYGVTKSSPLSPNNSVWPLLEEYSCTDIEKEALRNKIKYNGMSVGTIGTLNEFISYSRYYDPNQIPLKYFKAQLIRLESIFADSHIVNAISNELNRGIYL